MEDNNYIPWLSIFFSLCRMLKHSKPALSNVLQNCFIHKTISLHVYDVGLQFYSEDTLTQVFFCEYCEIFENTYSEEHLRTATSVLG